MVDPATEARFEMGNVVGDLAMGLLGDFVEVTTKREDGSLDIAAIHHFFLLSLANPNNYLYLCTQITINRR